VNQFPEIVLLHIFFINIFNIPVLLFFTQQILALERVCSLEFFAERFELNDDCS